jgi:DNA-binding GntR family transcriptional regulator
MSLLLSGRRPGFRARLQSGATLAIFVSSLRQSGYKRLLTSRLVPTLEQTGALVDRLAATIRARVLAGEFESGTRLRQESLASEFGVSRTPVREALRKLQASGLVRLEPHRGAVVRAPSAREVREAYEVRAELEGLAAALCVTRIRDEELRRLHEAQALFRRAMQTLLTWKRSDGGVRPPEKAHRDWITGNDLFHLAILDASGNLRLRATLNDLHVSFPRDLTWIVLGESSHLLEQNVAQHQAILDAIEHRNELEARRLMKEHVVNAGALVTLRFEDGTP